MNKFQIQIRNWTRWWNRYIKGFIEQSGLPCIFSAKCWRIVRLIYPDILQKVPNCCRAFFLNCRRIVSSFPINIRKPKIYHIIYRERIFPVRIKLEKNWILEINKPYQWKAKDKDGLFYNIFFNSIGGSDNVPCPVGDFQLKIYFSFVLISSELNHLISIEKKLCFFFSKVKKNKLHRVQTH